MMFPWDDWQFYAATLICSATALWWLRTTLRPRKKSAGCGSGCEDRCRPE